MLSLRRALSIWAIALVFLVAAGVCFGRGGKGVPQGVESTELLSSSPFTEATFSYSQEPEKTLLFTSSIGMSGAQNTVGLFGDGRLVFKKLFGGKVDEESMIQISSSDIERILRISVDFGLAEWDLTRVEAKQLENTGGRLYSVIPSDTPHVVILISLENYERGSYKVPHLERTVRFQGASFANRHLPSILEIRGIVELRRELYRLKREAENLQ